MKVRCILSGGFGGGDRVFWVWGILFDSYNLIRRTFSFINSSSLTFQQLSIHLHSDTSSSLHRKKPKHISLFIPEDKLHKVIFNKMWKNAKLWSTFPDVNTWFTDKTSFCLLRFSKALSTLYLCKQCWRLA